jgi:hypothetical protein
MPFNAQRRQAHDDAHRRRQRRTGGQRQRERPAHAGQYRLRVRAHAKERRVADRELPGKAGQQHQAHAHDAVDQDEGQLRQQVFADQPGRQHQQQRTARCTRTHGRHAWPA